MRAMVLNEYGQNSKFENAEVEQPQIKPGHVLVRVAASSVNTVDTMIRNLGADLPLSPALPAILGMDFAGTIESVGEGVSDFVVGDEVYGCAGGLADIPGALADYILADAKLIGAKPKTLSMKEAAAIPLVGITAYEGLNRARVKKGQNILVHGGTGGVGHLATQLAKYWGANVFATISNAEQASIVSGYGATPINYKSIEVSDYVSRYTDNKGFDVVYDTVGGENMLKSFEAASLNAQVVTTVSLLELDLTLAHFKGLSLHVVFMLLPMLHDRNREQHGAILKELAAIIDSGGLTPLLDSTNFSVEQIGSAYERLESGSAIGKVVVSL